MDFVDAQVAKFKAYMEGRIDFEGQAKSELLSRQILVISAIIAFLVGLVMQSITITAGVFSVGFLGCCIVVLPAYPSYNSNPVNWLPPLTEDGKVKALEEKSS